MKKFLNKLKNNQWLLLGLFIITLTYFGINFAIEKIITVKFFNKYSVLTVSGSEGYALNRILLNGKVLDKTNDEWTNVLPIPKTLKYITLTSSYAASNSITCGNAVIPRRVEEFNTGENEWCIGFDDKSYVSISSSVYFPYDETNIVYEQCIRSGYFQSIDKSKGVNGCAERGLFLNDKKIATSFDSDKLKIGIPGASSFAFDPSKLISNNVIYTKDDGTYSFNTQTEQTKKIAGIDTNGMKDIFITNDNKTIYIKTEPDLSYDGMSLGEIEFGNNSLGRIYSADYVDGHLYVVKLAGSEQEKNGVLTEQVNSYELLRDNEKIANFKQENNFIYGYDSKGVEPFPLCDYNTLVCIYEDGHYAFKNRAQLDYSSGYYVDEMIIDNKDREDIIPDMIGRSKPIFENGNLKYIVYTGFSKGLYLVNLDKKWSYKDINNKKGPAITKLLGGYQNKLLNVLTK